MGARIAQRKPMMFFQISRKFPFLSGSRTNPNQNSSSNNIKRDILLLDNSDYAGEIEDLYQSEQTTLKIFKNYRYQMKRTWINYSGLAVLDELRKKELLNEKEIKLLYDMAGHRTITYSLDEIKDIAQKYVYRYPDLFIFEKLPTLGKRVLVPSSAEIDSNIQNYIQNHREIIYFLQKHDLIPKKNMKILEIGYISGGESLIAFENLGYEVHGIDYFYEGQFDGALRYKFVQEITNTNAQFHVGDITKKTEFEDDTFDLIYSAQTIEHITDLKSAFSEMKRILKPGGIMYHTYDPFYHPLGGHSFGMLDCPWGHVRLEPNELNDYLRKHRKFEAEESIKWLENSINRTHTLSYVQSKLVESRFTILRWSTELIPMNQLALLNNEIIADAFRIKPDLSLEDLVTEYVTFIARKYKNCY
ncbi:class I SAM-dependent methyltransferase [Nostoc sp. CENA67]|uniref:Class I SAM-dependent methyltransferase n=1 Tax=Amazonocrinis nigriterrae CENA67 TaxID=2794033 RepID=A0A8J7HU77_9NOST|nr:class I SAM-dependent methyltransferase [Amazonocrinis nigriterrae]MBH8566036.1 class I SAM-dependent methyltransferase [Amazonocrinis nigriterrae CENA67]